MCMPITSSSNLSKEMQLKMKQCHDIFQAHAFERAGVPKAYKLHEIMPMEMACSSYCLGCAMTDSIFLISTYLKKHTELDKMGVHVAEYVYLLNVLTEHIETVLFMINVDNLKSKKEFAVFQELREWSYFFKPHTTSICPLKSRFVFENSVVEITISKNRQVLDKYFVKEYYNTKGELGEQIKDKYVLLLLPDIADLTYRICTAMDKFLAFLSSKNWSIFMKLCQLRGVNYL
jgi:hypothetical protein